MYKEQFKERMENGESIDSMITKMIDLERNIGILLGNIKNLCEDTGNDIIEASAFSVVCQVNIGSQSRATLVIGRNDSVKNAVKSLVDAIIKDD